MLITIFCGASNADVVSQWSFDGNLEDSAASGVNADHLTDNAGASYAAGVVGQAVSIPDTADGTNKLSAASSADLQLGENWTMEAFVFPTKDAIGGNLGEWERIWTKWGEGGEDYHLAFRGAAGTPIEDGLDLFVNGGANIINHNSTMTVPRNSWSHFAFVGDKNANSITAWLNGEQVGTTDYVEVTPTDGGFNFGNFADGNQSAFQYAGLIDEALIHNVAVDAAYLQGRAALIPEPSAFVLALLGGLSLLGIRRIR